MTRSVNNALQGTFSNDDASQITAIVQSAVEENDLLPLVHFPNSFIHHSVQGPSRPRWTTGCWLTFLY